MKKLAWSLVLFTVGSAAAAAPAGTLLVLNKSDDTVSFIDLASNEVKGTLPTGDGPHEVAVSSDGRTAVISNYGDNANPGKTLTVVDVPGKKVLRTIDLDTYRRPHGVAWLQGDDVAVTVEGSKALLIVNASEGKVKHAIPTDQAGTHMVAVSPKHRRAFTANIGSGSMSAIDLASHQRVTDVVTGKGAEGIAVAPDGSEVWVTNRESNTVSIIDAATLKITATLEPGKMPIRVKFTPDGTRALVSNAVSGDVAIFDTVTKKKLSSIPMQKEGEKLDDTKRMAAQFGSGPVPVGILMPEPLQLAFVANTNFDTITVIDLERLQIVDRLKAGREPDGLGYTPLTIQK